MTSFVESLLDPARAEYDFVLSAGEPWSRVLRSGQIFRIVDLEGCQAVDTLFYNAADTSDRQGQSHFGRGVLPRTAHACLLCARSNFSMLARDVMPF